MRNPASLIMTLAVLALGAPTQAQDSFALFDMAKAYPRGSPEWIAGMERAHRGGSSGASFALADYFYEREDYVRSWRPGWMESELRACRVAAIGSCACRFPQDGPGSPSCALRRRTARPSPIISDTPTILEKKGCLGTSGRPNGTIAWPSTTPCRV